MSVSNTDDLASTFTLRDTLPQGRAAEVAAALLSAAQAAPRGADESVRLPQMLVCSPGAVTMSVNNATGSTVTPLWSGPDAAAVAMTRARVAESAQPQTPLHDNTLFPVAPLVDVPSSHTAVVSDTTGVDTPPTPTSTATSPSSALLSRASVASTAPPSSHDCRDQPSPADAFVRAVSQLGETDKLLTPVAHTATPLNQWASAPTEVDETVSGDVGVERVNSDPSHTQSEDPATDSSSLSSQRVGRVATIHFPPGESIDNENVAHDDDGTKEDSGSRSGSEVETKKSMGSGSAPFTVHVPSSLCSLIPSSTSTASQSKLGQASASLLSPRQWQHRNSLKRAIEERQRKSTPPEAPPLPAASAPSRFSSPVATLTSPLRAHAGHADPVRHGTRDDNSGVDSPHPHARAQLRSPTAQADEEELFPSDTWQVHTFSGSEFNPTASGLISFVPPRDRQAIRALAPPVRLAHLTAPTSTTVRIPSPHTDSLIHSGANTNTNTSTITTTAASSAQPSWTQRSGDGHFATSSVLSGLELDGTYSLLGFSAHNSNGQPQSVRANSSVGSTTVQSAAAEAAFAKRYLAQLAAAQTSSSQSPATAFGSAVARSPVSPAAGAAPRLAMPFVGALACFGGGHETSDGEASRSTSSNTDGSSTTTSNQGQTFPAPWSTTLRPSHKSATSAAADSPRLAARLSPTSHVVSDALATRSTEEDSKQVEELRSPTTSLGSQPSLLGDDERAHRTPVSPVDKLFPRHRQPLPPLPHSASDPVSPRERSYPNSCPTSALNGPDAACGPLVTAYGASTTRLLTPMFSGPPSVVNPTAARFSSSSSTQPALASKDASRSTSLPAGLLSLRQSESHSDSMRSPWLQGSADSRLAFSPTAAVGASSRCNFPAFAHPHDRRDHQSLVSSRAALSGGSRGGDGSGVAAEARVRRYAECSTFTLGTVDGSEGSRSAWD